MTKEKKKAKNKVPTIFMILILLTLLGVLKWNVFTIKSISVSGTLTREDSDIIAQSGLVIGDFIFDVDTKKTKASLEKDPYLLVEGVYCRYPSRVEILVKERWPRAMIVYYEKIIVLDENGKILEVLDTLGDFADIAVVTGMDVDRFSVGEMLTSKDPVQLFAMNEVLTELIAQDALSLISELNLDNVDNLYLVSREGIKVQLGERTNMEDKIRWMRATLPVLREEGYREGELDVTSGKHADFMPPQGQQEQILTEQSSGETPGEQEDTAASTPSPTEHDDQQDDPVDDEITPPEP